MKFVYNDQVTNIVSFISIGFNVLNCVYGNTISGAEIKLQGMVFFKSGRHLRLGTSVGKCLQDRYMQTCVINDFFFMNIRFHKVLSYHSVPYFQGSFYFVNYCVFCTFWECFSKIIKTVVATNLIFCINYSLVKIIS